MKKIVSLSVVLAVFSLAAAKAAVLADWTFETSVPAGSPGAGFWITNIAAEVGSGTASGLHTAAGSYSTPAGNGSSHSFSANTWNTGDFFQFAVNLDLVDNTYSGINVTYDQNGSATGPKTFYIAYSTDGSTFTKLGADYALTSGITWAALTPNQGTQLSDDFSSVTALNTASTVYFRIVDDSATTGGNLTGGNIGTAGTDRMDNFVVNATITSVPEPATLALAVVGGVACLVAFRRKR